MDVKDQRYGIHGYHIINNSIQNVYFWCWQLPLPLLPSCIFQHMVTYIYIPRGINIIYQIYLYKYLLLVVHSLTHSLLTNSNTCSTPNKAKQQTINGIWQTYFGQQKIKNTHREENKRKNIPHSLPVYSL